MAATVVPTTDQRVVYFVSEQLVQSASCLPSNYGRSYLVYSLALALGVFQTSNLKRIAAPAAVQDHLTSYHDPEYIDFLLTWQGTDEESELAVQFGLEDDCPFFPRVKDYVLHLAGNVLNAANMLQTGLTDIAIVWDGGRHHASKARASGYCYINDVNLAILHLRKAKPRPRVLYIDLDLHFSDGVSRSFQIPSKTPTVLTFSVHHAAPGFFPAVEEAMLTSLDTPNPCSLSLPLNEGASNETFRRVWTTCVEPIKDAFRPAFVVLQCGVDGLAGDPCAIWNWEINVDSPGSLGWVVQRCIGWGLPVLMLGGGGYSSMNAARAWAYLTSIACGRHLPVDTQIPEHNFFAHYAPSFTLDVPRGNRPDHNTAEYLDELQERFDGLATRVRNL